MRIWEQFQPLLVANNLIAFLSLSLSLCWCESLCKCLIAKFEVGMHLSSGKRQNGQCRQNWPLISCHVALTCLASSFCFITCLHLHHAPVQCHHTPFISYHVMHFWHCVYYWTSCTNLVIFSLVATFCIYCLVHHLYLYAFSHIFPLFLW